MEESDFKELVGKSGKYKPSDKSWKQYFLMMVYYKDILKREYNFEYETGDASKILNKLTLLSSNKNQIKESKEKQKKIKGEKENFYKNINQHEVLGQGGFGTVFADREDKGTAYKLLFSKDECEKAYEEAEIQNYCVSKINKLIEKINVKIPEIYGYSKTKCDFCSITYDCLIAMERVPFFNKRVRVGYQLGMGVELVKEHPSDDGVIVYTHLGKPRGMFIRENDLIFLSEKYRFSWEDICQSWGFSIAALLFICKNDLNDLEYLLSFNKDKKVSLYIVDFGLSSLFSEKGKITVEDLDKMFKDYLDIDVVLPTKNNTFVYPEFINGIKMFASIFPEYSEISEYLISLFDKR